MRSILFVLDHHVPGIYNVAGDGLLPWSEVAAICGKRTAAAAAVRHRPGRLRRCAASACELPPSCSTLLQYGRGVDNRRLKRAGFDYHYTSAGTVQAFVEALRLRSTVGDQTPRTVRARRRAVLPPLAGRRPRTRGRMISAFTGHAPQRLAAPPPALRRSHRKKGSPMTLVNVEIADGVAVLTLDDPDRRNALNLPMVDEIVDAIDGIEADPDVGAVVVTGAPPAFCAGADLSHLGRLAAGRAAQRLRGLPARRPLAAADHRRGQRRRRSARA